MYASSTKKCPSSALSKVLNSYEESKHTPRPILDDTGRANFKHHVLARGNDYTLAPDVFDSDSDSEDDTKPKTVRKKEAAKVKPRGMRKSSVPAAGGIFNIDTESKASKLRRFSLNHLARPTRATLAKTGSSTAAAGSTTAEKQHSVNTSRSKGVSDLGGNVTARKTSIEHHEDDSYSDGSDAEDWFRADSITKPDTDSKKQTHKTGATTAGKNTVYGPSKAVIYAKRGLKH